MCLCMMTKGYFMYDRLYCTVDISQYCAQVSRFKESRLKLVKVDKGEL